MVNKHVETCQTLSVARELQISRSELALHTRCDGEAGQLGNGTRAPETGPWSLAGGKAPCATAEPCGRSSEVDRSPVRRAVPPQPSGQKEARSTFERHRGPGPGGRGAPASVSPGGTLRSHESAWAGDTEGAQWLRVHRTLRTASPETESGCVLPGPEAGLGSGRDGDGVSVWGEGKVWN